MRRSAWASGRVQRGRQFPWGLVIVSFILWGLVLLLAALVWTDPSLAGGARIAILIGLGTAAGYGLLRFPYRPRLGAILLFSDPPSPPSRSG